MKQTTIAATAALVFGAAMTTPVFALNPLQLGPDCDPGSTSTCSDWTYVGGGDDTWYWNGTNPFTLEAYANATPADGGNGQYAWASVPDADQYAYLVISAAPKQTDATDVFNVIVMNDTDTLSAITSGHGAPPVEDPNSLAGHGIFDTYFEIYEFQFDGALGTIENTQPPGGDPASGYNESFTINWTDSGSGLSGLHADLFTVSTESGGNRYIPGGSSDRFLVEAFAPFSHDAQVTPPLDPPTVVPEPSILALFGLSLFGLGLLRRRQKIR